MQLFDRTADELAAQDTDLAIIPIGSIEQHGPHLPLSTDYRIAAAFGEAVAEAAGGFSIPPLPVSTCREHMGKKGAAWMDPDVFYHMLYSMLMSLKEQGFRRAVTLQCHGGIFVLPAVIRQVNATNNPDFMAVNIDICSLFGVVAAEGITETDTELHAGEVETSLMLHIAPELVHMERAVDFVPAVQRPYLGYGSIFRASPSGVWGEPSRASADKGKRILERFTALAVQEMDQAFDYMQVKKPFGYSSF